MLFKENTKKRERQHSANSTEFTGEQINNKRKPAWTDNETKSLKVDINNESRLRKLKKSEKESTISGKYSCVYILSFLLMQAMNSLRD